MNTKKGTTQEYWRRHVDAVESSGKSIGAYCLEHNLSTQSLYQWRRKLRQRRYLQMANPFTRAELVSPPRPPLPDPKWLASFAIELIRGLL